MGQKPGLVAPASPTLSAAARTGPGRFGWLQVPVEQAAGRLLGCILERELDGEPLRVRIVETEAYDQQDEASHSFRGRSQSNDAMFMAAGHAYIYLSHGLHHCVNVVTGVDGFGSGVLIRAAEPLAGAATMERLRGRGGVELTNGPGKLCQALGITRDLRGHDLGHPPLRLIRRPALDQARVVTDTRIGISKATDKLRRFYVADSIYVSARRLKK